MKTLKQSFLTIAIGLVLIAGISYAWTGPTANPPLNNASAPINVGDSPQIKDGALQVNGFKSIGTSEFVGPAVFKGGTNKDGYTSFFPNSNGKNYIRGTTIIGDSDMDNRVGIGTADPIAKLDLVGNIKITDGTQGEGKVLTSDASGLASWAPIPPPPPQIKTVKKQAGQLIAPQVLFVLVVVVRDK